MAASNTYTNVDLGWLSKHHEKIARKRKEKLERIAQHKEFLRRAAVQRAQIAEDVQDVDFSE